MSKNTKRQLEIITAAGKILSNSGVSGLTIKNLAQEMQFTESALYRHFKGKDEIIESMLCYLAANMQQRLVEVFNEKQTPKENFITLFDEQFHFFSGNPHFVAAVFSDGLMEKSKNINHAIKKIMAVKYKYLMLIISKGQTQGVFVDYIETKQLIHIVMGSFRLLMFKWRIDNYQFDIKVKGLETTNTLLTLILTPRHNTVIQDCKKVLYQGAD